MRLFAGGGVCTGKLGAAQHPDAKRGGQRQRFVVVAGVIVLGKRNVGQPHGGGLLQHRCAVPAAV